MRSSGAPGTPAGPRGIRPPNPGRPDSGLPLGMERKTISVASFVPAGFPLCGGANRITPHGLRWYRLRMGVRCLSMCSGGVNSGNVVFDVDFPFAVVDESVVERAE